MLAIPALLGIFWGAPGMKAKPPSSLDWKAQSTEPTTEYRVTFWEQPVMENVPAEHIGWGEVTYDLEGVNSVHEAIEWAEKTFASADGPYSRSGKTIRDREYVLFARVPGEDRFVQLAGSDPTVNAPSTPPFNLPRQPRSPSS
jgi:hypothetical protein